MTTVAMTPRIAPVVTGRVRLRLTRRGRVVLAALGAVPLAVAVFAATLNGGGAVATGEQSTTSFSYVNVAAGETLWQLAESIAPESDPREVIADIVSLNGLRSADVQAGQRLAVPAQYAG